MIIKRRKAVIGILGGMGPQASARLLTVMVDMAAKDFGARNDDDFPEIIVDSIPVPDFISSTKNSKKALVILKTRVKRLEVFKPDFLAIACNTAHIMFDDLQLSTTVPFVSVIDEVARKIEETKVKKVGLLATPMTVRSGLYQNSLKRLRIQVITPSADELVILESVIRRVLAGLVNTNDIKVLVSVAQSLKKRGVGAIILGCTELPLIFPKDFLLPVFDSIDILAFALLRKSYGRS